MANTDIYSIVTVLSAKKVAELIGIHTSTLNRWVHEDKFPPPIRLGPARVGWRLRDVEDWLTRREAAPLAAA